MDVWALIERTEGTAGWPVCFGEMDCRVGVGEGLFLG